MLIKYIYMTSGFKTLQVNWKFVFDYVLRLFKRSDDAI